jgi:hypothetical protein
VETAVISRVVIDSDGRLHVIPQGIEFPNIWREAMEIHWAPATRSLHSPVPREWTYVRWFQQILAAAREQGWKLTITGATEWTGVDSALREQLIRVSGVEA